MHFMILIVFIVVVNPNLHSVVAMSKKVDVAIVVDLHPLEDPIFTQTDDWYKTRTSEWRTRVSYAVKWCVKPPLENNPTAADARYTFLYHKEMQFHEVFNFETSLNSDYLRDLHPLVRDKIERQHFPTRYQQRQGKDEEIMNQTPVTPPPVPPTPKTTRKTPATRPPTPKPGPRPGPKPESGSPEEEPPTTAKYAITTAKEGLGTLEIVLIRVGVLVLIIAIVIAVVAYTIHNRRKKQRQRESRRHQHRPTGPRGYGYRSPAGGRPGECHDPRRARGRGPPARRPESPKTQTGPHSWKPARAGSETYTSVPTGKTSLTQHRAPPAKQPGRPTPSRY